MSKYLEKERDIPDSDVEDYRYKYYEELKKGIFKIEVSGSKYRCPFCVRGRDYSFEKLLGHASQVGRHLRYTSLQEKACHLALEKYMERKVTSEPPSTPRRHQSCQTPPDDQFFVHPWMGVVANLPREFKDGRYVGSSGAKLKEELTQKGFNPQKVIPLWSKHGYSGFAIVEFVKAMDGVHDALKFERSFEAERHGRMEYFASRNIGGKLYGWVARRDDFDSSTLVGDYLRKHGDLKTMSGIEEEDNRKQFSLVRGLTETLQNKRSHINEIQNKCEEAEVSIDTLMVEKDEMIKIYNDDIKRLQQDEHALLKRICLEHKRARVELMSQRKNLEQLEKDLLRRESLNESERRQIQREKEMIKLQHKKEMNERATAEQRKADEDLVKLAEVQKREKEQLHKQIMELEKRLDEKQALELEIEQIKGALEVMKHMDQGDDTKIKKVDQLQEELEEKKEELEYWESTNQTLIIKERKINEELVDARKELINALKESTAGRPIISVKQTRETEGKALVLQSKKAGKNQFKGVDDEELQLWNNKEERPASLQEGISHVLKQYKQWKRKKN